METLIRFRGRWAARDHTLVMPIPILTTVVSGVPEPLPHPCGRVVRGEQSWSAARLEPNQRSERVGPMG